MIGADTDLFTLADAAALIGVKTDTLKKWFENGCPFNKTGTTYEVRIRDVFKWRIAYERQLVTQDNGEGGEMLSLEVERAKLAREQRIEKEMSNAVRRGELVEAAGVAEAWGNMIAICKAKLLAAGSRIASRAAHPNPRALAKELEAEIKLALKELADVHS